jgi:hypothetical protein
MTKYPIDGCFADALYTVDSSALNSLLDVPFHTVCLCANPVGSKWLCLVVFLTQLIACRNVMEFSLGLL